MKGVNCEEMIKAIVNQGGVSSVAGKEERRTGRIGRKGLRGAR